MSRLNLRQALEVRIDNAESHEWILEVVVESCEARLQVEVRSKIALVKWLDNLGNEKDRAGLTAAK